VPSTLPAVTPGKRPGLDLEIPKRVHCYRVEDGRWFAVVKVTAKSNGSSPVSLRRLRIRIHAETWFSGTHSTFPNLDLAPGKQRAAGGLFYTDKPAPPPSKFAIVVKEDGGHALAAQWAEAVELTTMGLSITLANRFERTVSFGHHRKGERIAKIKTTVTNATAAPIVFIPWRFTGKSGKHKLTYNSGSSTWHGHEIVAPKQTLTGFIELGLAEAHGPLADPIDVRFGNEMSATIALGK